MATHKDWLPAARAGILAMRLKWLVYMTEELRTAWGAPVAEFAALGNLFGAAQTLFQRAQDESERAHVITVECQGAFKVLSAKMRFFRDRYFKLPPITEGDWAALGFQEKDTHPSNIPVPNGAPAVSLSYPGGPHAIAAYLGPLAGTQELDSASDYGYALYMGIVSPGGATLEEAASDKHYLMKPPVDGKGLTHRFTRRRKEKIVFDAEDAGKMVYMCCRYENQKGQAG
jgi:hypothetical protein